MPNNMDLDFLIFSHNLFLKNQILSFESDRVKACSSMTGLLDVKVTAVSLAYRFTFLFSRQSGRSLIYAVNKRGPSVDPFGTPQVTEVDLDLLDDTLVTCDVPHKYGLNQRTGCDFKPDSFSLCNSISKFTVSNALLKVHNSFGLTG